MFKIALVSFIIVLNCLTVVTHAAEASREMKIDASPAEVWKAIGPFCSIADWYPGIDTCTEENIDGAIHRRLVTADGNRFLEKLLKHDDASMSYSYTIEQGPLPVADYSATIGVTDNGTKAHITWNGNFKPNGVSEAEAVKIISDIYDSGLKAISKQFAK